jgi:hypothetical protein
MQEYRAKQQAELDKAARLKAMRLTKAGGSSRPPRTAVRKAYAKVAATVQVQPLAV